MVNNRQKSTFWPGPVFAIILLLFLAGLINWPYLKAGFFADDIFLYNAMRQDPLPFSRWSGVWAATDWPCFDSLWWKDPDFKAAFWRPIPSLIIEGSIRLFDRNALPMHLFSILMHGLVASGLYLFVKELTGRHWLALLAGLYFVTCEDLSMTVGWISAGTDAICAFFVIYSMLAYIRWLKRRSPSKLILSLILLVLGMASKESAVIAPVALILLAFLFPTGSIDEKIERLDFREMSRSFAKRIASWLPVLLILIIFLGLYMGFGLGGMKNLLYIDPIAHPGEYISHMVLHLPTLWLASFSTVPIFPAMFQAELFRPFALCGMIVFIAWLAAFWPLRNQPFVQWAFWIYIISLLPQICTDASVRALYLPMIPTAILLAYVTMTIKPLAALNSSTGTKSSRWTRFMGWYAIVGILIPGTFQSVVTPRSMLPGFGILQRQLSTAIPFIEQHQPEHIVLLNASGPLIVLYAGDTTYFLTNERKDVRLLSGANGKFSLEKTGYSSFIIRTDRAGWLNNMFSRAARTSWGIEPGRVYETPIFDARILQTTEDNLDILAVEFNFKIPLDEPDLLFLYWNGESFAPIDMASLETGAAVELADTSDVWASMK